MNDQQTPTALTATSVSRAEHIVKAIEDDAYVAWKDAKSVGDMTIAQLTAEVGESDGRKVFWAAAQALASDQPGKRWMEGNYPEREEMENLAGKATTPRRAALEYQGEFTGEIAQEEHTGQYLYDDKSAANVPQDFSEARKNFVLNTEVVEVGTDEGGILRTSTSPDGYVRQTRYNAEGEIHDGNDGSPAMTGKYPDGRQAYFAHRQNGMLGNNSNGVGSVTWREDGSLSEIRRYRAGVLQDGAKNEPALTRYDDGGRPVYTERWMAGALHNGLNGEPAKEWLSYDEQGKQSTVKEEHFYLGVQTTKEAWASFKPAETELPPPAPAPRRGGMRL